MRSLGVRLREIREECGLSISDVQRISGGSVSNTYLSQVENGKIKDPGISRMCELAELYEIDLDEMLDLPTGPKSLKPQEADLLRVFRRLSTKDRQTVFEIAKVFLRLSRRRAK